LMEEGTEIWHLSPKKTVFILTKDSCFYILSTLN